MKHLNFIKKYIKFTLLALTSFFTITSCAQLQIGKVENGNYIVTYSQDLLKTEAEDVLKKQGITTSITSFEIRKDIIDGTSKEYYILLAENYDQSIKIATELTFDGTNFTRLPAIFGNSCTCTGCQRGCSPRRHSDNGIIEWFCSSCKVGTGCRKSETGD